MKRLLGKTLGKKKRKKAKEVFHSDESVSNPNYQFALKEYLSTVAPGTSNDVGQRLDYNEIPNDPNRDGPLPMAEATTRRRQPKIPDIVVETVKSQEDDIESVIVSQQQQAGGSAIQQQEAQQQHDYIQQQQQQQQQHDYMQQHPPSISPSLSHLSQSIEEMYSNQNDEDKAGMKRRRVWVEPEMPDTTYEEQYGDAYVGAPIKYIYPSGYQSMRPRSGPWKLSIAICALFTWLSIFIVGHCSDRAQSQSDYYAEIDDDELVLDTRWCGSRPLYIMWVASMLITGLAAAYCSVIGYIKIRDFAVANGRSQPPGMMGQTDYYVRIVDDAGSMAGSVTSASPYQHTIYQADGTPQFWGSHIYRPTQAAVAVTSR
jgi:hypothetical protein